MDKPALTDALVALLGPHPVAGDDATLAAHASDKWNASALADVVVFAVFAELSGLAEPVEPGESVWPAVAC